MFKRNNKESQNNDEIFVDYSNDIDVKKIDEDESIPEHYEALEIEDEVVVSTHQIKEAKQLNKQKDFIEQKKREIALEKDKISLSNGEEIVKNEINLEPKDYEKTDDYSRDKKVDDSEDIAFTSSSEDDRTKEIEKSSESAVDEEAYHQERERRIYPSFLHEELSVRRDMNHFEQPKDKHVEEAPQEEMLQDTKIDEEIEELHDEVLIDDQEEQDIPEDENISIEKKQDLHSFFGVDSSVLKQGSKRRKKIEKQKLEDNAKKPVYSYKQHDFYTIEEFTTFLNANYSNLDDIAQKILKDERFFRWLKEESTQFEESIISMKKIKQDLKQ